MMKEQSFSASSNKVSDWEAIDWPTVRRNVRRLQLRIAKAIRAGKHGKAQALSWLLTHSRSAKLLAVKRVTETKGAKTPGTMEDRSTEVCSSAVPETSGVPAATVAPALHP
jgi:RNA-directed DNA polymerase